MANYADETKVQIAVVLPDHPIAKQIGGLETPAIHIFSRSNIEQVVYSSKYFYHIKINL